LKNAKSRLREDSFSGEGEVVIDQEFMARDPLYRADVLGDWINAINQLYEAAVIELHEEWRAASERARRRQSLDKLTGNKVVHLKDSRRAKP
jgi:hypothetical protein